MMHVCFIAGEWLAGSSAAPNINPSDLSDVVGHNSLPRFADDQDAVLDCHVPLGGRKGSSPGPCEQSRYVAAFSTTVKTACTAA